MTYLRDETDPNHDTQRVWAGMIATDADDMLDRVSVVLSGLDSSLRWEDCRWQPKDNITLPKKGDECVVVMDDNGELWVTAWWGMPTVVNNKWIKGVGGAAVWSDIHLADIVDYAVAGVPWPLVFPGTAVGSPGGSNRYIGAGSDVGSLYYNALSGYQHYFALGDTISLIIQANGHLYFGSTADTNLYRNGAAALKTDGSFSIGTGLWVGTSVVVDYSGTGERLYFGALGDTFLVRDAANSIYTPGKFGTGLGITAGTSFTSNANTAGAAALYASLLASSGYLIAMRQGADSQWRFLIDATGGFSWGPGGATYGVDSNLYRVGVNTLRTDGVLYVGSSLVVDAASSGGQKLYFGTALDTSLYRANAGTLKTDGNFFIVKELFISHPTTPTGLAIETGLDPDAQDRWSIEISGKQRWGDGTATPDTNLYRTAAGVLKTDGVLVSAGDMGTSFPSSPINGQDYYYVAQSGNSVIWHFKWVAADSKWAFVGGPPLFAEVATAEVTGSSSYVALTTPGPSIALPFAGDYDVGIGCHVSPTAASVIGGMSYMVGATAADSNDEVTFTTDQGNANAGYTAISRQRRKTGLAAVTLTAQYKGAGANTGFAKRWMSVLPVRK